MEIIPGQVEHDSGIARKVFGFLPESCSPSARNRVRHQPGTLFDFIPETRSPSSGIRSNGIAPPSQAVMLQIGNYSVTIPAGSFHLVPNGAYVFSGVLGNASLAVQNNRESTEPRPRGSGIFLSFSHGRGTSPQLKFV